MIQKIPRGQIATYKQIAALAGRPQAVRAVAWILHACSRNHQLPWHRVLNAQGRISFQPGSVFFKRQKLLLKKEGIEFLDNGRIDLKRYQWKKKPVNTKADKRVGPRMFQ